MELVHRKGTKDLVGFEGEPSESLLFIELYRRRIQSGAYPQEKNDYFADRIKELSEKPRPVRMPCTLGVMQEILQLQDTYASDIAGFASANMSTEQFRGRVTERVTIQHLAERAIMALVGADRLMMGPEECANPGEPS